MIDQPSAPELLEAMAATLSESVVPACEGPAQHSARVVANLCRILAREFHHGASGTGQTTADLAELLGVDGDAEALVAALADRLESGDDTLEGDQLFAVLKANVRRRVDVAKPGYATDEASQ